MESQTIIQKKELMDWISSIEDVELLKELSNIKKHMTFNFEEAFKKGLSSEKARQLSKDKIREWWVK